ncbi:MAG: DUF983 domain-containing protein [Bacteroidetes bacterium]|nr:DUF983 domain-containing protein [Bacteroidota bacterium]
MGYKQSALYSIVNNKCPKCHEGNFFETNNPYKLSRFDKMPHNCPVCNEDFERETGFYYGAMYVSYGLTVAFGVGVFLLVSVLLGYDVVTFLVTFGVLQVVLMPVFYRMARLVWINFFVKYKEKNVK